MVTSQCDVDDAGHHDSDQSALESDAYEAAEDLALLLASPNSILSFRPLPPPRQSQGGSRLVASRMARQILVTLPTRLTRYAACLTRYATWAYFASYRDYFSFVPYILLFSSELNRSDEK